MSSQTTFTNVMEQLREVVSSATFSLSIAGPYSESILKNLEDLLLLILQIYRIKSTSNRVLAIVSFLKFRSRKPLLPVVVEKINDLLESLAKTEADGLVGDNPSFELQSDDLPLSAELKSEEASYSRSLLDDWERLDESPLAEKLRELMSYCMAFTVLEECGLSSSFADIIYSEFNVQRKAKKTRRVTGFLFSLLDVAEFVTSRARICYEDGSLKAMFHSATTYNLWYDKVLKIKMWSRMLDCPEENGFTEHQYLLELDEVIEKGDNMQRLAKSLKDRKAFGALVCDLKILRSDHLTVKRAAQTRRPPFTILMPGGTGVGKTFITDLLFDYFAKLRNLPTGPEYKYTRNSNDEFWSGFKSSKLFVLLDDIGYMLPSAAKNGDPSMMEMLQMINPAPFTTNQAALEDKGKVPFMPEFVIANTNTRTMNVDAYFSFPSAIQRRFEFLIEPVVKPGLGKGATGMLDSSKTPKLQVGKYSDNWVFNISQMIPQPIPEKGKAARKLAEEIPILTEVNLYEMLKWFKEAVELHYHNQQIMLECTKNMETVVLCEHKFPSEICVECHPSLDSRWTDVEPRPNVTPVEGDSVPDGSTLELQEGELQDYVFPESAGVAVDLSPEDYLASVMCEHCGHPCPWMEEHQDYCAGLCTRCHECISEEDKCFNECTACIMTCNTEIIKCVECHHRIQFDDTNPDCDFCRDWFVQNVPNGWEIQSGERIEIQTNFLPTWKQILVSLWFCFIGFWHDLYFVGLLRNPVRAMIANYERSMRVFEFADNEMAYTAYLRRIVSQMGENAEQLLVKRPYAKALGMSVFLLAAIKIGYGMSVRAEERKKTSIVVKKVEKSDELKCTNLELQGVSVSKLDVGGMPPQPHLEAFNPWKNENYELTSVETTRLTKSMKALSREKFVELISKNLVFAKVRIGNKYRPCNMFCICDRYYLANTHCVKGDGDVLLDILFAPDRRGVTQNVKDILVGRSQITPLTGDLSIVHIPQLSPKRDFRMLLATSSFNAHCDGYYINRSDIGCLTSNRMVKNIRRLVFEDTHVPGKVDALHGRVDLATHKGFCGSLLVLETGHGPVLGGLHYMGSSTLEAISQFVSSRMVEAFFEPKVIVDVGELDMSCSMNSFELQTIHYKSPVLFVEEGTCKTYGSLSGFRASHKSNVAKTLTASFWKEKRGIEDTHCAPILNDYRPWRHGLLDMTKNSFPISWEKVEIATNAYLLDITSQLSRDEADLLEIYDLETVLNGAPGVQYVDKININTSAGWPFNTTKKKVTIPRLDKSGRETGFVDLTDEVIDRYNGILEAYSTGNRCNPIFVMTPKDEPQKKKKFEQGKTRLFAGCPVAFTLVTRKYCGSFIRVMQRNRLIFESAVGTNTHADDWQRIADFVCVFGNDLFDGDYQGYDKTMMSMIINAAALIPMKLMMYYGKLSDEDVRAFHCLAADLAYSWVNYNGDLMSFLRNNPSGHALTVIINCIVNSTYFRLAYMKLCPSDPTCLKFKNVVRLVTYGDDFIAGINSKAAPWFNFGTVKDALSHYGIVLTRADKEEGTFTYKPLGDIDFLKRTFVHDGRLDRYVAPLSMASIHKSLVIGVRSKTISHELQVVATMSSALREMFFHGEDAFNLFRAQILECIDVYDLKHYVGKRDFPTHDELLHYYKEKVDTEMWGQTDFILDASQFELQCGDIFTAIVSKDAYLRQRVTPYLGTRLGNLVHPITVYKLQTGHLQGVGSLNGHLCLVEYINQKAYTDNSYCPLHSPARCVSFWENGLSVHFHTCDPQSPYLGKENVEAPNRSWPAPESCWPRLRLN